MAKKQSKPKPAKKKKPRADKATRFKKGQSGNPNGRPPIITPKIIKDIEQAIYTGAYIETAAVYAGITKETLYAWMKIGAKAKAPVFSEETGLHDLDAIPIDLLPYALFSDAIGKALADSQVRLLKQVDDAAGKDWRAAAWRLERKWPKQWGRRPTTIGIGVGVGDGVFEDGKPSQPAEPQGEEMPSPTQVLNPHKPMKLHVTLAIGDKEVELDDTDDEL